MRVLFTGASSFTGLWFVRALAAAGHTVVAPLPRPHGAYDGIRERRVAILGECAEIIWSCRFGDERFLRLASEGPWDRLCHHAAQVGDYRSADFDVTAALTANTHNLPSILHTTKACGLAAVVLTGSVFEAEEGIGTSPRRAFSPYGLSKGLTGDVFRFWCARENVPLIKFVIANPFGPFEEPRFCDYLIRCWTSGKTPAVGTPAYVRDNIHVSLLALCYADAVVNAGTVADFSRCNPSGYAESQGAFAQRFAREIGARLKIACPLELATQRKFIEPPVRISSDTPDHEYLGWDETVAWDELARYYQNPNAFLFMESDNRARLRKAS